MGRHGAQVTFIYRHRDPSKQAWSLHSCLLSAGIPWRIGCRKLFPQTSAAGGRVALNPDSRPERERDIFPAISSWTITHLTGRVSCVDRCVGVILRLACAAAAYFDGIDSDRNGPRSVDKTCGDKSDSFFYVHLAKPSANVAAKLVSQRFCLVSLVVIWIRWVRSLM